VEQESDSGLHVFQHLFFGESIHKAFEFTRGEFLFGTFLANHINFKADSVFDLQGYGITAGNQPAVANLPPQRDVGVTFVRASHTAIPNNSDCTGTPTNDWGCGSGSYCSSGVLGKFNSVSGSDDSLFMPIDVFEDSYKPPASYMWDAARGYSRIQEILCFHRKGDDAQGAYFLGSLPNVGLTSTEPYLGGNEVSIDGDTYIVFPQHVRSSPWDRNLDATGSSGAKATNYDDRGCNHHGVGLAIRKPV